MSEARFTRGAHGGLHVTIGHLVIDASVLGAMRPDVLRTQVQDALAERLSTSPSAGQHTLARHIAGAIAPAIHGEASSAAREGPRGGSNARR